MCRCCRLKVSRRASVDSTPSFYARPYEYDDSLCRVDSGESPNDSSITEDYDNHAYNSSTLQVFVVSERPQAAEVDPQTPNKTSDHNGYGGDRSKAGNLTGSGISDKLLHLLHSNTSRSQSIQDIRSLECSTSSESNNGQRKSSSTTNLATIPELLQVSMTSSNGSAQSSKQSRLALLRPKNKQATPLYQHNRAQSWSDTSSVIENSHDPQKRRAMYSQISTNKQGSRNKRALSVDAGSTYSVNKQSAKVKTSKHVAEMSITDDVFHDVSTSRGVTSGRRGSSYTLSQDTSDVTGSVELRRVSYSPDSTTSVPNSSHPLSAGNRGRRSMSLK